jgi:solute carrier family 8 (sodium/calcium exchanger)
VLLCVAAVQGTASYVHLNDNTKMYDEVKGVCAEAMFINGPDNEEGKDGVCANSLGAPLILGNCKLADQSLCSRDSSITDESLDLTYQACVRDKGDCGPVHLMEFEAGNMFLEYKHDASICAGGLFLPFIPGEMMWGTEFHIFLYFVMLVFSFLGVAIIADVFMAAIEVITSKERTVKFQVTQPDGTVVTNERTFLVWNATVANLSLMALGSSAPEILISVIETLGTLNKPVDTGGLGAGTIVGSAAFNLLVIIAICVGAIKGGDTRKIEEMGVFTTTAIYSVFAYIWLFICVQDNQIEMWEAIVTLLFFPILVVQCYLTDTGFFCGGKKAAKGAQHAVGTSGMGAPNYGGDGLMEDNLAAKIAATDAIKTANALNKADDHAVKENLGGGRRNSAVAGAGGGLVADEALKAAAEQEIVDLAFQEVMKNERISPMKAKINARRQLAGRQRVVQAKVEKSGQLQALEVASTTEEQETKIQTFDAIISFSSPTYAIEESKGKIELQVVRSNKLDSRVVVAYATSDGTALSGEDYKHVRGDVTFEAGETTKTIVVELIDDNEYEPDENFFVTLKQPKTGRKGKESDAFEFGEFEIACVTILNDDRPGYFGFEEQVYSCQESDGYVSINVVRKHGSDGSVTVRYMTQDGSAIAGSDYEPAIGELMFVNGETMKTIKVRLLDDETYEKSEQFSVELTIENYPSCGAEYNDFEVQGTKVSARTTVVNIIGDEDQAQVVESVARLMRLKMEKMSLETSSWVEQFDDAMNIQGEEGQSPSTTDFVMHFLTFGWKVIFALVPPTCYWGGWLTFGIALAFIGLLTAFVSDIASLFGCLLGLQDSITAITFVALGTSLPDTFASKTAAENDDTADASVGNVTGSNSVNVFLGLGLPWVIATFAHIGFENESQAVKGCMISFDDGSYPYLAGDIGFSVVLFCVCATLCITTLYVRRFCVGAELGGPEMSRNLTSAFFVLLWLIYVVMSALQVKGHIDNPFKSECKNPV